jgi:hypothetical protein
MYIKASFVEMLTSKETKGLSVYLFEEHFESLTSQQIESTRTTLSVKLKQQDEATKLPKKTISSQVLRLLEFKSSPAKKHEMMIFLTNKETPGNLFKISW